MCLEKEPVRIMWKVPMMTSVPGEPTRPSIQPRTAREYESTRISVVCTGKGSHREIGMRSFDFGHTLSGLPWKKYDGWLEIGRRTAAPLKDSYTFTCRRCARETRMKAKTLRMALDGLRADGYKVLDISRLPY